MLHIIVQNGITIARFKNISRFNSIISQSVKDELNTIMKHQDVKLIIDFDNIKYIDSSAFGALISILKTAKENNGKLRFSNMSSEVMELIEVMQLNTIFNIFATIEDALIGFYYLSFESYSTYINN